MSRCESRIVARSSSVSRNCWEIKGELVFFSVFMEEMGYLVWINRKREVYG